METLCDDLLVRNTLARRLLAVRKQEDPALAVAALLEQSAHGNITEVRVDAHALKAALGGDALRLGGR